MTNEVTPAQISAKLDKILIRFNNTPETSRYEFIANLKKWLDENPVYRTVKCHPLFTSMIEFHIAHMQAEYEELDSLKRIRILKQSQYGYDNLPKEQHGGYPWLTKQISDRCAELDVYITEYQRDLQSRTAAETTE